MRGAAASLDPAASAAPRSWPRGQVEGFAAVLGFASFVTGFSATLGAALACFTAAGPASFFGLAAVAAAGFLADAFPPRCRDVCFSVSAAIAAISAVPDLAGPV